MKSSIEQVVLDALKTTHSTLERDGDEWGLCGTLAVAIKAQETEISSLDGNPNAEWLTIAHLVCAEAGIAPGHISERLRILCDRLSEEASPEKTPAAWIDYRAMEIARQFTEPKEGHRRAKLQSCITAAMQSAKRSQQRAALEADIAQAVTPVAVKCRGCGASSAMSCNDRGCFALEGEDEAPKDSLLRRLNEHASRFDDVGAKLCQEAADMLDAIGTAPQEPAAPDVNAELLEALKYARRMVNASECDIAYIDAAVAKAGGAA